MKAHFATKLFLQLMLSVALLFLPFLASTAQAAVSCSIDQATLTSSAFIITVSVQGTTSHDSEPGVELAPVDGSNPVPLNQDVPGVTVGYKDGSNGFTVTYTASLTSSYYQQNFNDVIKYRAVAFNQSDTTSPCANSPATPQKNAGGGAPGTTPCTSSDASTIQDQLAHQDLKSGNATIIYHSCDTASSISVGFTQTDGSEPTGTFVTVPCGYNQDCTATFPVPSGDVSNRTIRINAYGSSDSLLLVTPKASSSADPCAGITGDARSACQAASSCKNDNNPARCAAEKLCNAKKDQGYVFTPAFWSPSFNTGCYTLSDFIKTLLNYFMMFAALIAGGMFAKGSFTILTSRGNPSAIADARSMLINAAVGLIIVASALVIVNFLNGAFQVVDPGINLKSIIEVL